MSVFMQTLDHPIEMAVKTELRTVSPLVIKIGQFQVSNYGRQDSGISFFYDIAYNCRL